MSNEIKGVVKQAFALGPFLQATNAYIEIVENRLIQIASLDDAAVDREEIGEALHALAAIRNQIETALPGETSDLFAKPIEVSDDQLTAGVVLPKRVLHDQFKQEIVTWVEPDLEDGMQLADGWVEPPDFD